MPSPVWKGHISFGLVSFPVRLFAAARPEPVHFHMLHKKDMSRLKQVWYCEEENKRVERADIVKGYETSKNKYVVVEDEELKKVAPATATTMEVLQFVDQDEVDPIFFEHSYYVGAEDKTAKPYVLFTKALSDTKQAAIANVAMHNREHVVLIRASDEGLILHTLYYPAELHRNNKRETQTANYTAKELELARSLINHLKGPFKPDKFEDTYRQNVERLIKQKQKGQEITTTEPPRKAPVIDLMDALKRSLQSATASKSESRPARAKKSQGRKAA